MHGVEFLLPLAKTVNDCFVMPRQLGVVEEDLMQIPFNLALPTFIAAKMTSEASSELLGDP